MADIITKFSDVKSLKDLARVFTLPTAAVAYFLQTGPTVGFDDLFMWSISPSLNQTAQLSLFAIFFILKTAWISFWLFAADQLLWAFDWAAREAVILVVAIALLAFGLMGIFMNDAVPQLSAVNRFWFFAFFVWGFYLMGRLDPPAKT